MYFIVGLGNPGLKYENTRHNVGFITIDKIAEENNIRVNKLKFKALVGQGEISGQPVMLVKPQTFMNDSGKSVKDIFDFYKPDKDKLIVILDDIDIKFGTVRIKKKGSAGSHNGMKSIIYQLGFDDFTRVKIAVGQNESHINLANYVLSGFNKKDVKIVEKEILSAKDAVKEIIENNVDTAMNKFNSLNFLEDDE
ncbi:MAG: aminoacyl-tRNA hydrolase [Tissierellia bacterium]|nr:aminoacyl-tRNA hydrolase [Tissierellia bacterium]